MKHPPPERLDFPINWDELTQPSPGADEAASPRQPQTGQVPPTLNLVAAAWADLVCLLCFCTTTLLVVVLNGYAIQVAALPWVASLAVCWWCAATSVLVVVRRGTPGMLMAGLVFGTAVRGTRLPALLVIQLVSAMLLGLPGVLGARLSPLRLAGGTVVASLDNLGPSSD